MVTFIEHVLNYNIIIIYYFILRKEATSSAQAGDHSGPLLRAFIQVKMEFGNLGFSREENLSEHPEKNPWKART